MAGERQVVRGVGDQGHALLALPVVQPDAVGCDLGSFAGDGAGHDRTALGVVEGHRPGRAAESLQAHLDANGALGSQRARPSAAVLITGLVWVAGVLVRVKVILLLALWIGIGGCSAGHSAHCRCQ
ncbi:hypothetical protein ACQEVX_28980 [Streptomyces syringium]|uniref:hypothetical protein n=1 Tax=Streptomyces syringium TaxID=76729 RepID=UPI003D8AF690